MFTTNFLSTYLIPYKFEYYEDREPTISFHFKNDTYGIYMLSLIFWIEMLVGILLMCSFTALVTSLVTYPYIILPQQQQQKKDISRTSKITKYLVGYGILIPLWLLLPYKVMVLFDLRNRFMKFCILGLAPVVNIFRTLEAIYDCVPSYATKSMGTYALYSSSITNIQTRKRRKRNDEEKDNEEEFDCITSTNEYYRTLLHHFIRFIGFLSFLSIYQSMLYYYSFDGENIIITPQQLQHLPWYSIQRLVSWEQLCINLCNSILLQISMLMVCEGLRFVTVLVTRCHNEKFMDELAFFRSTSITNFWGQRWNRIVHLCLKRGIYIPIRKSYPLHRGSKAFAAVVVFLASGLFHEWMLTYALVDYNDNTIPYGGATAFMLWNAMTMLIEYKVTSYNSNSKHHKKKDENNENLRTIKRQQKNNFKNIIIIPLLILLTALPVGHWFMEPYLISNFFDHASFSIILIRKML